MGQRACCLVANPHKSVLDAGHTQKELNVAISILPNKTRARVQEHIAFAGRYRAFKPDVDFTMKTKVVGTGVGGPVRQAVCPRTGRKFAVKSFMKQQLSATAVARLKSEVEIFLKVDHPNITRLEWVYETREALYLVMEFMEGGELFDQLEKRDHFPEVDAADAMRQMLRAVAYLHDHNIVHRDLALGNFMYADRDVCNIKLLDFGLSMLWDDQKNMTEVVGTPDFLAPEVLDKSYTEKADVWSMGVISYMLLTGSPLFAGHAKEDVLANIMNHKPTWSSKFKGLSSQAQEFVKTLVAWNPQERPSVPEALQHAWLTTRCSPETDVVSSDVLGNIKRFADVSNLRRACLRMMAWSMSPDDRKTRHSQFFANNSSNTGTISCAEFRQAFEKTCPMDEHEAEHIFFQILGDSDEGIEYNDFLAASLLDRSQRPDSLLRSTFLRFDLDHDGVLSMDDLNIVLGEGVDDADVQDMINDADLKQDAAISYEQFLDYLQE